MNEIRQVWQLPSALVVSGLILIAVGFPLMRRRVPPNRWYGVRTRSTLADERTWYAVNERSGRDLLIVGFVVILVGSGASLVLPHWRPEFRTLLVAFVLIAGLAAMTVRAVRHAGRLRRDSLVAGQPAVSPREEEQ
jgi:uncharacterized membrane protein